MKFKIKLLIKIKKNKLNNYKKKFSMKMKCCKVKLT